MGHHGDEGAGGRRALASLRADCASCAGLCCVVPAFAASADFAIDKPAGTACPNLRADHRCGIHARLRDKGFPGCTVYDCFGAGQQVTQAGLAGRAGEVFPVMRDLHELLYYVTEALGWPAAEAVHGELGRAADEIEELIGGDADVLVKADTGALRAAVAPLLRQAGELVRGHGGQRLGRTMKPDLMGARLKGADLRRASLRGGYLIGADLRGADLRGADVIGADFRNADLSGADLRGCLFLTQSQLDAARGDAATRIPPSLSRPGHWRRG
ncbi:pentapeptide repeat-containing protein [Nonomuraea sp. NPDC003804]|uniref:pentapeptide repeat-containing protein n=1 Tax=Nonomuraea sp. NPDC003804 TaxID=3154547 RepID=UPI0033B5CF34